MRYMNMVMRCTLFAGAYCTQDNSTLVQPGTGKVDNMCNVLAFKANVVTGIVADPDSTVALQLALLELLLAPPYRA